MIEKLTQEQIDSMPRFVEKWTDIAIRQKTRDLETVTKNIHWLYEQCGFDPTNVSVHIIDSLDEWIKLNLELGPQVRSQVRSQVESQVWSQVRSQVWSQVRSQVESQVWYRADDLSYGDFFYSHGFIKDNKETFYKYADVLQDAGMAIYLEDRCYLLAKPTITTNTQGQTHNEETKAIRWSDGSGLYLLHGVTFEEDLWQKIVNGKLNFKDVSGIKDIDQRWVAYKMLGADELLEGADAKLLDESERGNKLYLIEGFFTEYPKAYFLRYECPSTGRIYISGIDPEVAEETKDADASMAWKHGISKEAYQLLEPNVTES